MEDLMIEIGDEYYVVKYSARCEPSQMVDVWHKTTPLSKKLFEVNHRATTAQVIEFIKIYLKGYGDGYNDGTRRLQDSIKKLLSIRD